MTRVLRLTLAVALVSTLSWGSLGCGPAKDSGPKASVPAEQPKDMSKAMQEKAMMNKEKKEKEMKEGKGDKDKEGDKGKGGDESK